MRQQIHHQRYCFVLVLLIAAFIALSSAIVAEAQPPRHTARDYTDATGYVRGMALMVW
ncbi:MAG TPA: hypothetical protein VK615_00385 [Candidatus Binatia bacterium]|nr:hypothetical protein [Candidatus Binatia bacterium]